MTRGRRPLIDRPCGVEVNVPETVWAKVNLLLLDPVTGGRKKGAWSTLVTGLLRKWLEEQQSR